MQVKKGIAKMPLVSICIPTYNRPAGLRHTLSCAVKQDYENLEILVSDNGSQDSEEISNIINTYQSDPRILFHRYPVNRGFVENFNLLISWAKGKYIIFMPDDDDYFDPTLVRHGVEAIESNPDASCAQGNIHYMDGEVLFVIDSPPYKLDTDRFTRLSTNIRFDCTGHLMYGLVRASFLKEFRWTLERASEIFLILHLLNKGPIVDSFQMQYRNNYTWPAKDIESEWFKSKKKNVYRAILYIQSLLTVDLPLIKRLWLCSLFVIYQFPFISYACRSIGVKRGKKYTATIYDAAPKMVKRRKRLSDF